jgi:hypothetical protein
MGDLLYFPGAALERAAADLITELGGKPTEEFIETPWKRTMEEWGELMAVDPSLEERLRRFRKAFFDGV